MAVIIGDAEREMRKDLVKGERGFQLDLIHALRDTSFKLWQDEEMTLEDRKGIIRRLESALFALKNSVVKHRKDGKKAYNFAYEIILSYFELNLVMS